MEPAPGDLRIVQALLNTAGIDQRTEQLVSPRALADWLMHWTLLSRGSELGPTDLERMLEIRAGLRALVRANRGQVPAPEAVERLDLAASAATLRVRFAGVGGATLVPASGGLDEALARLFEIVAVAHRDGHWQRLKLCIDKPCRSAFYDFSNGRSAKWCTARCGNKGSARTYRRRRKHYQLRAARERHAALRSQPDNS